MKVFKILLISSFNFIIDASKRVKEEGKKSSCCSCKTIGKTAIFALILGTVISKLQGLDLFSNIVPDFGVEIDLKRFDYENYKEMIFPDKSEYSIMEKDSFLQCDDFEFLKRKTFNTLKMEYDISREIVGNELTELAGVSISSLSKSQMAEYSQRILFSNIQSLSSYSGSLEYIRYQVAEKFENGICILTDSKLEEDRKLHKIEPLNDESEYFSEFYWYQMERAIRDCNLIFNTLKIDSYTGINTTLDQIEKQINPYLCNKQ